MYARTSRHKDRLASMTGYRPAEDGSGTAPVTWRRRPADDNSRTPTQVATSANPTRPPRMKASTCAPAMPSVPTAPAPAGSPPSPIPRAFDGDFPHVTLPGLDYFDRSNQRPAAYRVGAHLTPYRSVMRIMLGCIQKLPFGRGQVPYVLQRRLTLTVRTTV